MRRLVLTALALALGLGFANAQSITKSLQGAQDPRGPVGMDTSNSSYFPGHINSLNSGPGVATSLSGCGAPNVITAGSTDNAGFVSMSNGTSCSVVFGSPFNAAPNCVVLPNANVASPAAGTGFTPYVTTSTTSIQVKGLQNPESFYYICIGNQ